MRLVLDTNIVVSGLIWGGIPRQLMERGRDNSVSLFTSSALLDELAEVLGRGKFASMLAPQAITPAFLMQRYGMLAQLVKPEPIQRTVRDADDDIVIATALAAQAHIIVTGDSDLLVLHPYEGIQILNATDALQQVVHST